MSQPPIWARDLPKILKKIYKKTGSHYPNEPELSLIDLVEWVVRIPSKSPRAVHKSKELQRRILTPLELKGLAEIERICITGGDLKPFLGDISRSIRNRLSKKNDCFSSDWGLLHLHLGPDFSNKKIRVSRSKRVLIARFENNSVYFIDVVNHGRGHKNIWGETILLEILYKNWPHISGGMNLTGILVDNQNMLSAADYIDLRKAGITSPITIDGQAYIAPGFGVAMDGSHGLSVSYADMIQEELSNSEKYFREMEPDAKAFLVLKNDFTVGFLVPKKNMYYVCCTIAGGNITARFFHRLISEVTLTTDKTYTEFITPKRIKL